MRTRPAQRRRGLPGIHRLEHHVRHRAGERAREQLPEVDVLIAVGFGAQQRVGDDALAQRAGRRGVVRDRRQRRVQRLRQLARARRRVAVLELAPVVEEEIQIGDRGADRVGARFGRQPREFLARLCQVGFEIGRSGHPDS